MNSLKHILVVLVAGWSDQKHFSFPLSNSRIDWFMAHAPHSFAEADPITNSLLENMDDDELETHRAREESNNIRLQVCVCVCVCVCVYMLYRKIFDFVVLCSLDHL